MMKECVVLNGQVINIGPWDFQIQRVEVEPAEYDEEGNVVKEPVFEEIVTNPLPEGAEIVEMEVVEGPDGGLYPAGYTPPETPQQKIARLEAELAAAREENLTALEAIAELYEMFLTAQTPEGGGGA